MIKIKRVKRKIQFTIITFTACIALYFWLDNFLIIDNPLTTYGVYDFFGKITIDAQIKVRGTGKQIITDDIVSTEIEILEIINMKEDMQLKPGDKIIVNEYLKLFKNRYLYGIPFLPGRTVTGMGTNYKRLTNGEIGVVRIHYDTNKKPWVEPNIIRIP